MNSFSLLIFALITVCSINSAAVSRNNGFQSYIDNLLNELESTSMDAILYWNYVTLQTCANDYDPLVAATPDQVGPTGTSRAFAIIHGAMYEAMASFNALYKPVYKLKNMPDTNSVFKESAVNAAIMEAAYQTLYALYPKQRPIFDAVRKAYLKQQKTDGNKQAGINGGVLIGQIIAAFILADRENDGSKVDKAYTLIKLPGYHQPDPTHPNQSFLGVNWGNVRPFLLSSGSQYRPSNFIGDSILTRNKYLNSTKYINEFNEIKSLGAKTSTVRSKDQTEIGIYWAYDGAPKLGVPPRLYNQIVRVIAIQQLNTLEANARLFALVNYAMADAGIAAWNAKYYYNFWRPIVGIRQGTGYTPGDPNWLPLGSPADNAGSTDFTPGFPAYVSGHSTFGSATFESLRQFYNKDNIRFQFQSDEYNGKTFDSNTGKIRPAKIRAFQSLTEAETENYLSRIYLGVHWRSDQEEGQTLGRKVGQHAFRKFN
ncbi:unnamed protein product [Adineta ricciae]|uniref:Phosphatidic acid phosphatase type 2/haloperoxidase domain-containing protein n=1 Tax=Adineta ricciae TaxID=249248 RepID=A0A816BWY6_ADIRI|nr:unnamed protein product [Adineta ricciae]